MPSTVYSYSVSSDTANASVATDALWQEILDSSIIIAPESIVNDADDLDITMKDAITKADLDAVVLAHQGVPIDDTNVAQLVHIDSETPSGTPLFASKKADGSSFTAVTHDFTDKTTWYKQSIQSVDETLTGSGVGPYSSANPNWIDVINGKVYQQHTKQDYAVIVKVDDVVQTIGYTIDHASGEVTFDSSQSGVIKATYHYQSGSTWILEPDSGKEIGLEHSEIQFTKDCTVTTPVAFEVWAYNPLFNPGLAIDPDDKTFIPGVSSGNPLRFMFKYEKYHNIKDIINTANLGQGSIPALSGLTNDILVFPFNYVTEIKLKSSEGAQLRITLYENTAFTGEWATATFYCTSEDEG